MAWVAGSLSSLHISYGHDVISWRLEPSSMFSMGSLYKDMFRAAPLCDLWDIWKAHILAKIKIFLSQVESKCLKGKGWAMANVFGAAKMKTETIFTSDALWLDLLGLYCGRP